MAIERHSFRTIQDLTAVPLDKIDAMVEDLRMWLSCHRAIADGLLGHAPEGVTVRAKIDTFDWIDDGQHNANVTMSIGTQPPVKE